MKCQTTILDFQKWEKWRRNLDRIKQEILRLYTAREMFKRLYSLFNNHENLKKCPNQIFFTYLWNTYVVYLGMGIRRFSDKWSKANLCRLLEDMKKNIGQLCIDNYAEYLSKKRYEKLIETNNTNNREKTFQRESYHRHAHEMACRAFEDALGKKDQAITCHDLENDIKNIKANTEPVKTMADKCWAHIDVTRPTAPKFDDVDKCLDHLIKIYNKYSLLTAGPKFEPPDEVLFNQWDAPFRMTWTE